MARGHHENGPKHLFGVFHLLCVLLGCKLIWAYQGLESLSTPMPTARAGWGDTLCGAEEFPCGNTSECIERNLHCDGIEHCRNGEDEQGCTDAHGSLRSLVKGITKHQELEDVADHSSFGNCSLQHIPAHCECRFFTFVYCKGENLTSVPQGITGSATKMVLTNSSIEFLPEGAFSQYTELKVIHIEGNRIRRLLTSPFLGIRNATILIMMKNHIESITPGAFAGLENLEWLLLQANNIAEIDMMIFANFSSLQVLDLTDNNLKTLGTFSSLESLFWLGLENNKIKVIEKSTFCHLKSLEVLILKGNALEDIEEDAFNKLYKLLELDISHNFLTFLRPKLFWNLRSLNKLNLEFNRINSLPLDIFTKLHSLKSLDLQGMDINNIDIRLFRHVTDLEFIYFKRFLYCSYAPYIRICTPKTDGLSSTEHLLVWPALRMSVWVVALMTCIGNTVVLTWRVLSRKEDRVLSLFIKNLAFSDLLMGIYLLAVGAQDVSFRDKYNKYAHAWMTSWHCTACGIIAMVSSEVSVLILSLITFERYRCIRTNVRVVTLPGARYCLILVWIVGIVLALIPVFQWSHEQGFYSSNGLCFPLHIDDPYLLGWQYSAFVFFGINFTAVILIIALYLRMFFIIKHDRQSARPVVLKKHEDAVLALRFFFIVLTDCFCWIPIVLIKLLALVGFTISHNLYACVVVFILPINSALNPVLYTIAAPTELRRRIEKWSERVFSCLRRLECLVVLDPKTPASSLTQSLTATESRSVSNGSILPVVCTTSLGAASELESCLEHHESEQSEEISTII